MLDLKAKILNGWLFDIVQYSWCCKKGHKTKFMAFFLNRILHESRQSKHVDIVLFTIATANAKTLWDLCGFPLSKQILQRYQCFSCLSWEQWSNLFDMPSANPICILCVLKISFQRYFIAWITILLCKMIQTLVLWLKIKYYLNIWNISIRMLSNNFCYTLCQAHSKNIFEWINVFG